MTEERQKDSLIISKQKGVPVYAKNPSIPNPDDIKKRKAVRYGSDQKGFVVDGGSGDVLGVGAMGFYEFEEVDNAKLCKNVSGRYQTGGRAFKGWAFCVRVSLCLCPGNPNNDKIELSYYAASEHTKGLL